MLSVTELKKMCKCKCKLEQFNEFHSENIDFFPPSFYFKMFATGFHHLVLGPYLFVNQLSKCDFL